jgi:hypothetical protein
MTDGERALPILALNNGLGRISKGIYPVFAAG